MPDAAPVIAVADLRKVFRVLVREGGLGSAIRSLVRREHRDVPAVDGIIFEIAPGEVVGFLGPNGAGKTTTLKMLSGLLFPTSGELRVLGHGASAGADEPAHTRHAGACSRVCAGAPRVHSLVLEVRPSALLRCVGLDRAVSVSRRARG